MKETMTPRERVLRTLNGEIADRVPWVEIYVQPDMVEKIVNRPVTYPAGVRLGLEAHEKLALDNVSFNLRPPIYGEMATAHGQEMVKTPWLKTMDDVNKLRDWLPDPNSDELYENAYQLIREKGEYAAIASMRLGVASMYNSMGYEDFVFNMLDDPELISAALDVYCDWCAVVLKRVNKMGFDAIVFSEDIAFKDNPMVTKEQYLEHIFPHAKKVADLAELPVIYHSDGYYKPLWDVILQYKPKAMANLEPPKMDIFELKEEYGDRVVLMGNIDLHHTLTRGTVQETIDEVRERLERVGKGGGYILASANGLPNYCIPENILAMNDTLLKYGWYE